MKFTIWMQSDDGSGPKVLAQIDRSGPVAAASLGLTLSESKGMLANAQHQLVEIQFREFLRANRTCAVCAGRRTIKDYHSVQFNSLFGSVPLRVPRVYGCGCDADPARARTVKLDGLDNWVAPSLEYVQSQLACTMPYAPTARLLSLILPLDGGNAVSTVRRRTLAVGQRLDAEIDEPVAQAQPAVGGSSKIGRKAQVIVGFDGGYVHDCRPGSERAFEVVVGRILGGNDRSRSIGFVRSLESNVAAARRINHRLVEQGHEGRRVTVFSDGDSGLLWLQRTALPKARHVLDWYHLTRRLTVLKRVLSSEDAINQIPTDYHAPLCKRLTSMKWRLWHGHIGMARNRIKAFLFTLRLPTISGKRPARKLKRRVLELERYINSNQDSLTNYGQRYRNGQRISTAFMESAVNQLIDKRMSKSQQMSWSRSGAHALLQVRAEFVDGKLGETFSRWYPGFEAPDATNQLAA